jgi:hypothetical protein
MPAAVYAEHAGAHASPRLMVIPPAPGFSGYGRPASFKEIFYPAMRSSWLTCPDRNVRVSFSSFRCVNLADWVVLIGPRIVSRIGCCTEAGWTRMPGLWKNAKRI